MTFPSSLPTHSTIPLFDLEQIETAAGDERTALIQNFGDALRYVGFLAVKAESISTLINEVYEDMKRFFHQAPDVCMTHWHNNNNQSGYCPKGSETAAGAMHADNKHHYMVPPKEASWKEGAPLPPDSWQKYHSVLTSYAAKVMGFLGEYLHEETEDISKSMKDAHNLLRLAHYPARGQTDNPQAMWAAAHEDLNALTLLPPATAPGLRLLTKAGEWLDVVVPPGYLIVNTGEQVEMKTAGKIKATRHEVVNPGGVYERAERFAAVFFGSWSDKYSLQPFGSCAREMTQGLSHEEQKAYLSKYPDVCVNDNLFSRLIEMGSFKNPSEALVTHLRSKGLLKKPTVEVQTLYPHLF